MPAEDKVGLDPLLEGGKAQFLEASDFGLGERLGREIRERRPAPETECCSQGLCGGSGLTRGEKLSTFSEHALKTAEIDLLGLDREPVTMSTRLQAPVTEGFAQLRDVDVDAVERARGRPALPERVDQAVCRDDFAAAQEKNREQRALLSRSDLSGVPRANASKEPRMRNSSACSGAGKCPHYPARTSTAQAKFKGC